MSERVVCSCGYDRLTWEQCPECGEYGGRQVPREEQS